jgi:hypothetical protein
MNLKWGYVPVIPNGAAQESHIVKGARQTTIMVQDSSQKGLTPIRYRFNQARRTRLL